MERHFLGWSAPALHSAASFLLERFSQGPFCDLREVHVVVPVSRAARRLLELLTEQASERDCVLLPPAVITAGDLPELFYDSPLPFSSTRLSELTWAEALLNSPDELQLSVLGAVHKSFSDLLPAASRIAALHRELLGAGHSFEQTLDLIKAGALSAPEERWEWLSVLQDTYLQLLGSKEFVDRYAYRNEVLQIGKLSRSPQIILIGAIDLNHIARSFLKFASPLSTSLVFAPEDRAEAFDDVGTLVIDYWLNAILPVDDQNLAVCDRPEDQAEYLAGLSKVEGFRQDPTRVAIGLADELLAPHLRRAFDDVGLPTRLAAGRPLLLAPVGKLLTAAARLGDKLRTTPFAAFLRHPDLLSWLYATLPGISPRHILKSWDEFSYTCLPRIVEEDSLQSWPELSLAVSEIRKLLSPFWSQGRDLSQWCLVVRDFLGTIYSAPRTFEDEYEQYLLGQSLETLSEILSELEIIAESDKTLLNGVQALHSILHYCNQTHIPPASGFAESETLGWLELCLDDAPNLLLCGMNEGRVPQNVNADPLLPDALRATLGLLDNRKREARDSYILASLCSSKEYLKIVCGRRDEQENMLLPSRLLLRTSQANLLRRVDLLYGEIEPKRRIISRVSQPHEAYQTLRQVPKPKLPTGPITRMAVSGFRAYLQCPYRYYLEHVCKLEESRDLLHEMDPLQFGSLLHAVLSDFGTSALAESVDSQQIEHYLLERLHRRSERIFGHRSVPAVYLQIAQAESRLSLFAQWQAKWRNDGWKIIEVETPLCSDTARLSTDDGVIEVVGRIDRVDYNETTREWAVMDYKTSEKAVDPYGMHLWRGEWRDLQLPLYEHFYAKAKSLTAIRSGYIAVSADTPEVRFLELKLSEEERLDSLKIAHEVAASVLRQEFWPPSDQVSFDPFFSICSGEFQSQEEGRNEE